MYTPINIDTYNLDKSSTRVNFFIFSQVFATGTAITSKGIAPGQVQKAT